MSNPPSQPADLARYEALLREAEQIKGTSLWQDAWKRFRRNRVAFTALWFLAALVLAAFFTPLIPFQSPSEQHLAKGFNRQFDRPNFKSRSLDLVANMQPAAADSETEAAEPSDDGEDLSPQAAYEKRLAELWHNPGFITRQLIALRVALFGDYALPSLCGNDHLGRDLLARLFWGARVSILVGVVATLVSLVIGVSYGAIAGYMGGRIDSAMMRFVDILYSIPFIFLVIFIISVISEDSIKARLESFGINRIVVFYIVLGAIYWLTMSRVVRGQIISLKNEQFVEAARTIGAGQARIIFRHLVPNVLGVVIVYLTLTIPSVMLFEAFLSFLGLGVEPPDVSWGLLAQESIKVITPVRTYWWLVVFPGLALASTLLALNFLGDGLRDALDPRMKNK